jgi:hypothetical protein
MGMGGGDKAQKAAQRSEAERESRVSSIYDSPARQAQIDAYGGQLFDFLKSDLDKQNTNANRDLKFSLARSGLTGGSRQIDAGRTQGEEYQEGLLGASRRAEAGKADLRASDEAARLNLTNLANQGLTGSEAYIRATQAMQGALQGQRAQDTAQGLGDVFGSVLQAKTASEEAGARRRADRYYTDLYRPFFGSKP